MKSERPLYRFAEYSKFEILNEEIGFVIQEYFNLSILRDYIFLSFRI